MKSARRIGRMGCRAVLVKGGHSEGDAADILFDGDGFHRYTSPRIDTRHTHGTGCTLSSAIAANLALGMPLPRAVERAKAYVTTAIAHAPQLGGGSGPTHHFYDLYQNGLRDGEPVSREARREEAGDHVPRLEREVNAKCDNCIGRLEEGGIPACVQACKTSALEFGEVNDLIRVARTDFTTRLITSRGADREVPVIPENIQAFQAVMEKIASLASLS